MECKLIFTFFFIFLVDSFGYIFYIRDINKTRYNNGKRTFCKQEYQRNL